MKYLRLTILFLSCLFYCSAIYEQEFLTFQRNFNKVYPSEQERTYRFHIFQKNMEKINLLNDHSTTANYGITKFSDLTEEEFRNRVLVQRPRISPLFVDLSVQNASSDACAAKERFPEMCSGNLETVDWRQKGAVTGVKDQGTCGSCWSFGTTGDIEGAWYLAGNKLISLSEQMLVSCDYSDYGCGGGLQSTAFDYIIKVGGIESEEYYPYKSGDGGSFACQMNKKRFVANISSWVQVTQDKDEAKIAEYVQKNGPITIAINATPMQHYQKGIDNPSSCDPEELNHAVLIVGFGSTDGTDYWIIKNSWGADWGEDGYYRIVRGENKCGVAEDPVHSII
jgi:C1A family cysteine protease